MQDGKHNLSGSKQFSAKLHLNYVRCLMQEHWILWSVSNPKIVFNINKLSLEPWLLLRKSSFALVVPLGDCLAHGQQSGNGSTLLCDVISGFSHNQEQKASFCHRSPDSFIVFGLKAKVSQKTAELCTKYPFFNDHRSEWVRRKKHAI